MSHHIHHRKKLHLTIFISFFIFIFLQQRETLTSVTLEGDEIFSWLIVSKDWKTFAIHLFNDSQKFLYYVLLKLWRIIIPVENDYWIRVPSLLFSSLSVSFFYLVLSRFLPVTSAIIGTFLYAKIPILTHFASYNRPYSLLMLLGILNILCVYYLLNSRRHRNLFEWLFLLLLILLLETHYLSVIYSLSILLSLFILKVSISYKKLGVLLAYLVIYFFQLAFQWKHSLTLVSWIESAHFDFVDTFKFFFLAGNVVYFQLHSLIGVIFLFWVYRKKFANKLITFSLLSVALGLLLSLIFSFLIIKLSQFRYYLFYLPYLFIAIAYGLHYFVKMIGDYWLISVLFLNSPVIDKERYSYREDIKGFFYQIKNEKLVAPNSSILCVYRDTYTESFSLYSKMHFNKDICSKHIAYSELEETTSFDIILFMQSSSYRKDNPLILIDHFYEDYSELDFKIFKKSPHYPTF